jgi:hypothetical protein
MKEYKRKDRWSKILKKFFFHAWLVAVPATFESSLGLIGYFLTLQGSYYSFQHSIMGTHTDLLMNT